MLRRAAQSAVRDLRGNRLNPKARESRVNFLRSAVGRLLRFAQDLGRDSLRDEIRDRYVQPIPELRDEKNNKNARLLASMGLSPSSLSKEKNLPRRSTSKCGARYRRTCRGCGTSADDEALARRD